MYGSKAIAELLGLPPRRRGWPSLKWADIGKAGGWDALRSALEDFNREQGGARQQMPVYSNLVSAGRGDLLQAIRAAGVILSVAACCGLGQGSIEGLPW